MNTLKRYKYSIIWASIIMIGCTIKVSGDHEPLFNIPHKDKILHFGIFGILGLLSTIEHKKYDYKMLIICIVYGILIEIIQIFLPWRSYEFMDIIFDSLGAWAGILAAKYLYINKLK